MILVCRTTSRTSCTRVAADKTLRSSSKNLLVPQPSTKFGDCSFSIAGPTAWNSLPDYVKNASSEKTFKHQLNTYLFKQLYNCYLVFQLMYSALSLDLG